MPPFLADDLTVENHRGGAETERHRFSHAALHKRLQVRVELRNRESMFVNRADIQICTFKAAIKLTQVVRTWTGRACVVLTYTLSDLFNEEHDEQCDETHS